MGAVTGLVVVLVCGGLEVEGVEAELGEALVELVELVELDGEPASARNTAAPLELADDSDDADPPDELEPSRKQPLNAKHNAVAIAKLIVLRALRCVAPIDLTWESLRLFAIIDFTPGMSCYLHPALCFRQGLHKLLYGCNRTGGYRTISKCTFERAIKAEIQYTRLAPASIVIDPLIRLIDWRNRCGDCTPIELPIP